MEAEGAPGAADGSVASPDGKLTEGQKMLASFWPEKEKGLVLGHSGMSSSAGKMGGGVREVGPSRR